MSELYDRIVSQRGSLENLMAKIPGFRGYLEHMARHKADTMLRDYLAGQIQQQINELIRVEKLILDNVGMTYLSKTRNTKGKIQLYHDLVATAAPGYSGMWAQMKIGPEEMEKIYSFDESQIRYVEKLDQGIEQLKQAALKKEGLDEAIYNLDEITVEANEAFSLRDEVLTNLSKTL